MLSEVRQSGDGRAAVNAAADGGRTVDSDLREPPIWRFGSRVTTRNVQAARKAYVLYAEFAERSLNGIVSATVRAGRDLSAIAGQVRGEGNAAWARSTSVDEPVGRGARLKAKMVRVRGDLRDIALRGQIAADNNVRAYLDHIDDLAKASSARQVVSAQTTYVWDQWQRSLQQGVDLQQRMIGALRNIASTPTV